MVLIAMYGQNMKTMCELKNLSAFCATLGLTVLALGLAHHFKPNQKPCEYYFSQDEKIGYSADGRKWVVEERLGDYDLVWQIKSDGNLLWHPPLSPQRFRTRFVSMQSGNINMSIVDDSVIMTEMDSVVIKFTETEESK